MKTNCSVNHFIKFSLSLFCIASLTMLSNCSDSDSKSSSSGIGDSFEGTLTGPTALTPEVNKNTIKINWEIPVHDTLPEDELDFYVYLSTENNMTSLSDTISNGRLVTSNSETTFGTVRGLVNSTTYYITVVVYNNNTDEPIAAFKPASIVTGIGPVLTSLMVSPGTPVAIGSSLTSNIWSGNGAGAGPVLALSSSEGANPCGLPREESESNIAVNYGSAGQTDTGWNPGGSADLSAELGRCVAICNTTYGTLSSICTNHVEATAGSR